MNYHKLIPLIIIGIGAILIIHSFILMGNLRLNCYGEGIFQLWQYCLVFFPIGIEVIVLGFFVKWRFDAKNLKKRKIENILILLGVCLISLKIAIPLLAITFGLLTIVSPFERFFLSTGVVLIAILVPIRIYLDWRAK